MGVAILLLAVTGVMTTYNIFIRVGISTLNSIQSSYLLEEGIEAVSVVRDYGWGTNIAGLTIGTKYYLSWVGGKWTTTTTASKIDNFYTRYVVLSSVYRDVNDNIASSGTLDSGTRKVISYVSWQSGATTTTKTLTTYLTNLFNN